MKNLQILLVLCFLNSFLPAKTGLETASPKMQFPAGYWQSVDYVKKTLFKSAHETENGVIIINPTEFINLVKSYFFSNI